MLIDRDIMGNPMDQTKEELRNFVARHLGGRKLQDDEPIFSSGFVSSMFAMQLVLFLEKKFSISIGNEDLELDNFQTITAMATLVQQKNGSVLKNGTH
jgi:methoxymalonate biosynthesis acyl carrier protein